MQAHHNNLLEPLPSSVGEETGLKATPRNELASAETRTTGVYRGLLVSSLSK